MNDHVKEEIQHSRFHFLVCLKESPARLAQDAMIRARWGEASMPALENTELACISLVQADEAICRLLSLLGLEGYERTGAVDMTVERIREMGAASVEKHQQMDNVFDRYWDFSLAREEDEGYFVQYGRFINGARAANPDTDEFEICAFVDQSGVKLFELRDSYATGGMDSTPERLLTADEMQAAFERDHPRREKDGFLAPVLTGMELKYSPMRAPDKKKGMVMAPVWYVTYDFTDGVRRDGWAWYSAVDGKLIMDCYH